jgi:hypothetical protein
MGRCFGRPHDRSHLLAIHSCLETLDIVAVHATGHQEGRKQMGQILHGFLL